MEWSRENSKEEQITAFLSQKIRSGELTGGMRLLPVRTWAQKFQTSLSVVNRAFDNLEKLNLLERRPRSGVFVQSSHDSPRKAALILDYLQDIHAFFPGIMQRVLSEAGYLVTVFDTDILRSAPRLYYQFLSESPELIVFNGWHYFPTHILEQTPKKCRTVCFHRCEIDLPHSLDCSLVLSDMFQIGYQAVQHLLHIGKKRILILSPEYFRPDASAKIFRDGAVQALTEAGLFPGGTLSVIHPNETELLPYLTGSTKCDGAVGLDFVMKELVILAKKHHVRVPDDFAVVGVHNTPWSESYHFPSMDLQPEIMAHEVVTAASRHDRNRVFIPPRLVIH